MTSRAFERSETYRMNMKRILLIEDDEAFRKPLAEALRRAGHEVELAGEGRAALRLFKQTTFDLVVTDLFMPEMEGVETILALHRMQPGLPIIAMSGGGMVESQIPLNVAHKIGAVKTLTKPFRISELLGTIAEQFPAAAAPTSCTF